jgi:hypothetical protein
MTGEEKKLEQLKISYKNFYKNYSIQFTLGLIWLLSALIGKFDLQLSIFSFFFGIALLKPALFLFTSFSGLRKIHKDESINHLTKFITIGILFGMIVVFFPFLENINYFFPAFTLIFGLISICIAYTSRLISYGILGLLLIIGGIYLGYYHDNEFTYGGFYSGSAFLLLDICNGIAGKKYRLTLARMKKVNLNNRHPDN